MLNEAVVHGFDGAIAADRPAEVDGDVAAALISNHFAMLTSPTWEMQRPESAHAIRGTGQTLQWQATDTADGEGAWLVERRPDGATWQPGTRQADVTVTGPAGSLLQVLTRRLPLSAAAATQRRRRHRPRPALARQHRPRQRLTSRSSSMTKVFSARAASVDGFITGRNAGPGRGLGDGGVLSHRLPATGPGRGAALPRRPRAPRVAGPQPEPRHRRTPRTPPPRAPAVTAP